MKKFPWDCKDCPMLRTYDMSIDDLTHICLWSKKQIDDCDRYKSAECPMENHDTDLLDKVLERVKEHHYLLSDQINSTDYGMFTVGIEQVIEELKAEGGEMIEKEANEEHKVTITEKFYDEDANIYDCFEDVYQQGARDFVQWLSNSKYTHIEVGDIGFHTDDHQIHWRPIDNVLAEWQKDGKK